MLESLGLAGLLLPMGVALGWYLARRYAAPESRTHGPVSGAYLQGVAHLVNDDPDQAIAHFVKLIEVDDETVETHLMLGSLFRKRGEVDRALRIHQNLIARPNLSAEHLNEARFELAQDHLKAGLLDGAEELLRDLVDQGMFLDRSLELLVGLYEQERDWHQAIDAAKRLAAVRGEGQGGLIGQYLCELAQQAVQDQDWSQVRKHAEAALRQDTRCVRASLLLGLAHEKEQRYGAAIKALQRVPEQDARYLKEALPALERCFEQEGDADGFLQYLEDAAAHYDSPEPVLARAKLYKREGLQASDLLTAEMQRRPSWRLLRELIEQLPEEPAALEQVIAEVRGPVSKQLDAQSPYLCHHCGLKPRMLFWQCPGCKQWGSIAPADDRLQQ